MCVCVCVCVSSLPVHDFLVYSGILQWLCIAPEKHICVAFLILLQKAIERDKRKESKIVKKKLAEQEELLSIIQVRVTIGGRFRFC